MRQTFWHSRLSYHLNINIPYKHKFKSQVLHFQISSLLIHLGKQWEMTQVVGHCEPCHRPGEGSCSRLHPGLLQVTANICRVNQQTKSLSICPSLFICNSEFQINTSFLKRYECLLFKVTTSYSNFLHRNKQLMHCPSREHR